MSLADQQLDYTALERLIAVLNQARRGNFSARMEILGDGIMEREVATAVNELVALQAAVAGELGRLADSVTQGELHARAAVEGAEEGFARQLRGANTIVAILARHASELRRVVRALHHGDFARSITVGPESPHRGGELLRCAEDINGFVTHLERVVSEVTRVIAAVGLDGTLNAQTQLSDASGLWGLLVGSVNAMTGSLSEQVQDLCETAQALANGDLSARASVTSRGDLQVLKLGLNGAAEAMAALCGELRRIAQEVSGEGHLGSALRHPNPRGEWQSAQDACNRALSALSLALENATAAAKTLSEGTYDMQPGHQAPGELGHAMAHLLRAAERERATHRRLEALLENRYPETALSDSPRDAALFRLGERLKQQWLMAARAGLLEAATGLRGDAAAAALLSWLAHTVRALAGALYTVGTAGLTPVAHHGCHPDMLPAGVVPLGEGVLGVAAEQQRPVVLRELDEHRVRVRTGLLEIVPSSVVVYPLVTENRVGGLVELAFVDGVVATALPLLDFLSPDLEAALQRAFGPAAGAEGTDKVRALNEELTIATARLERMGRDLQQRDKTIHGLQRELAALRAESDKDGPRRILP